MKTLVHATAIRVGDFGLLFVGPSGSGKTTLAMLTIATARRDGFAAQLISDDQVFIERTDEETILASAPETIFGMVELRGSGIGKIDAIAAFPLHLVIKPVSPTAENRIPVANQQTEIATGISLPTVFLNSVVPDPFFWLTCLINDFPRQAPKPE